MSNINYGTGIKRRNKYLKTYVGRGPDDILKKIEEGKNTDSELRAVYYCYDQGDIS